MANQSSKKNQQSMKSKVQIMNFVLYPLFGVFLLANMFFLIGESVSFWHLVFCALVVASSHLCIKQTIKCWQLQLPDQASEYYIDILAMNSLVAVLDPFTHKIWHIYWLIVLFLVVIVAKYGWEYITPKYEANDEENTPGRKEKKQKKDRVKYLKK